MRHSVIAIILILTIPTLSQGSVDPDHHLDIPQLETVGSDLYHLRVEQKLQVDTFNIGNLDLTPMAGEENEMGRSLDDINGGLPHSDRPVPRDMLSMMSFVWAEMFGGVDIVAEIKDFARQVRRNNRPARVIHSRSSDSRNQWKFIVACRIDEQTEVAALFKNRGRLFGEGNMALQINALDPMSEEIGLKMAYSDGELDIRADRMTLTEKASAKLMVKF